MKLKAFCVTQNETPKMAKNIRLYLQVVTFFCGTRQQHVEAWFDTSYFEWVFESTTAIPGTEAESLVVRTKFVTSLFPKKLLWIYLGNPMYRKDGFRMKNMCVCRLHGRRRPIPQYQL